MPSSRGRDDLLAEDHRGGHEEGPEDVRILEERTRAAAHREQVRARHGRDEREHADDRRRDRRGEVAVDDQPRPARRHDVAGQPQREQREVERHAEVRGGAADVGDVDGRHQAQRAEHRQDRDDRPRDPAEVEPARGRRDRDRDEEHAVGRRRLEDRDAEQQEPERHRGVVAGQRQREHRDQPDAAGDGERRGQREPVEREAERATRRHRREERQRGERAIAEAPGTGADERHPSGVRCAGHRPSISSIGSRCGRC